MSSPNEWVASQCNCLPLSQDTLPSATDLLFFIRLLPTLHYQLSFLDCASVSLALVSGVDLTVAVKAVCAARFRACLVQFHCLRPIQFLFVFIYVLVCLLDSLFPVTVCPSPVRQYQAKDRHSLHSSQRDALRVQQVDKCITTHVHLSVSDEPDLANFGKHSLGSARSVSQLLMDTGTLRHCESPHRRCLFLLLLCLLPKLRSDWSRVHCHCLNGLQSWRDRRLLQANAVIDTDGLYMFLWDSPSVAPQQAQSAVSFGREKEGREGKGRWQRGPSSCCLLNQVPFSPWRRRAFYLPHTRWPSRGVQRDAHLCTLIISDGVSCQAPLLCKDWPICLITAQRGLIMSTLGWRARLHCADIDLLRTQTGWALSAR